MIDSDCRRRTVTSLVGVFWLTVAVLAPSPGPGVKGVAEEYDVMTLIDHSGSDV